jgi:uroporphyrinogen III methyltransferase/synthase
MTRPRKPVGRITFVGAGPGDPGLLTLHAEQALRRADLILADPDVPTAILAVSEAEVRTVGSEPAEDSGETGVAKTLVAEARNGHQVIRLISGDPLTTAAVVKECQAVARTTVPFDVAPGVAVDSGVPGYAGVPLVGARTVVDLRGEEVDSLDWSALAQATGSLVLTGVSGDFGKLAAALVEHGRRGDTPVTATSGGTTLSERTIETTLDALERDSAELPAPLVLVIGSAAKGHGKLSWWESRALYGWKVLVPRTKDQAGAMSERLRLHGAVPSEVPTIAVEPPRTPAQMERAIKGLVTGRYEWIVFTSVNAVRAVREKFDEFGLDARAFAGVKIACIGESTADAVRAYGISPELLPSGDQSSEGLLADFSPYDEVLDPINRVLLPRADIATETLAAGLRDRGWEIDDVTAYRTVRAAPPPAETREAIKGGGFDAVCFTSSSTVRNLVGIAGKPHARTIVACIGPKTAETAREFGLRVDVQPDEALVPALVDALAAHALALREAGEASPPPRRRSSRSKTAR